MDQIMKRIARPPRWVWELALLALAIWLPYMSFMDRSRTSVAVLAGVYVMLGLSLNVIVGYAGLFQLGHAAFFGLGAYTAAILSIDYNISILATIPIAALVAGGAAILITKPILHLRGDYLCIVTIAFGEIFRIGVTNNAFGITGGSNGLIGAGRPEFPVPWIEPVPMILLALILVLHLYLTRKSGPVLQWGGAVLVGLAYYLVPRVLDHDQLFVASLVMGIAVLIVGAMLRDHQASTRVQIGVLIAIVAVFVLSMVAFGDQLTTEIDGTVDEYFNIDDPVKVLGVELTPLAFKRNARPYYFLVLAFIVITIVGMRRLQDSRLGRAWLYVREDQLAAEAMGIDATQVKMAAFAIGSAWAGVAGVLYASRFTVVAPENFNFLQSVIMFCIVVLGGSGSIPGVLVGTLGMVVLPELLRDVGPTFLYEGNGPVVILVLILGGYLLNTRDRWQSASIESAAIAAAFFLPSLLLNEPALRVIGMLMALIAIIVIPLLRRRRQDALRWALGGLAVYAVVLLVVGSGLAPDVERQLSGFRIMDWRDGLMGVAMVLMMVLRPAGIIPEKRRGIVMLATEPAAESASVPAAQQTV